MRQTSIDAYYQIRDEGLLGKLQFDVYEILYKHGPLTQGEISMKFFGANMRPNITPRFAELENLGVISAVGKRPCEISGRGCVIWDVTSKLPEKKRTTKPVTRKQKIEQLRQFLRKTYSDIRQKTPIDLELFAQEARDMIMLFQGTK